MTDIETAGAEADDERMWKEALQSTPQRPTIRVKRRRLLEATTLGDSRQDDRERPGNTVRERQGRVFQVAAAIERTGNGTEGGASGARSSGSGPPSEAGRPFKTSRRRRQPSELPGPVSTIVYARVPPERSDVTRERVDGSSARRIHLSEYRVTLDALERLRETLDEVRAAQGFVI